MLSRIRHAFWKWYYRRQIDSKGGLMFFDGMLEVIEEREHAIATQPKVESFLAIPSDAIWSEGIRFDRPNATLAWISTYEDFKRDILRGKEWYDANIAFLGFNFQYITVNFSSMYLSPHRGQSVSSVHLTSPFRSFTEIIPEYDSCADTLRDIFGPPTTEEDIEFFLWPKHTRRSWNTPFLKISHSISDIKDSDPVNKLLIERRYSNAYFAKYPNAKQ